MNVTDRQMDKRTDGHRATAQAALMHSIAWQPEHTECWLS